MRSSATIDDEREGVSSPGAVVPRGDGSGGKPRQASSGARGGRSWRRGEAGQADSSVGKPQPTRSPVPDWLARSQEVESRGQQRGGIAVVFFFARRAGRLVSGDLSAGERMLCLVEQGLVKPICLHWRGRRSVPGVVA